MRRALAMAVSVALICFLVSAAGGGAAAHSGKSGVASADTTKVEKERVRKETAPPPRHGEKTETHEGNEGKEDDFFSSFLGSCLGDLLGSMLGSVCGGSSSEGVPTPPVVEGRELAGGGGSRILYREGGVRQELPFLGTVTATGIGEDSVEVWDRPGGGEEGGAVILALAKGTEVTVTDFESNQTGLWLRVETPRPGVLTGWLRDKEVLPSEVEPAPRQMAGKEEFQGTEQEQPREEGPASRYEGGPRFYLRAEGSFPVFGSETIQEEYKAHGWVAGLETDFFLTRSIHVGLLFDYLHADGTPQFQYETATSIDWPLLSDLDIVDFGAHVGQLLIVNPGNAYFKYGIGPAVFRVKEKASVAVYEGSIRKETRTDELSQWKFGGEATVEGGFLAAGTVPIGAYLRFSWIPWKSEKEKSLTLDYLDRNYISVFDFGFSVGYLFF